LLTDLPAQRNPSGFFDIQSKTAGDDNDVEMDRGSVKNGDMDSRGEPVFSSEKVKLCQYSGLPLCDDIEMDCAAAADGKLDTCVELSGDGSKMKAKVSIVRTRLRFQPFDFNTYKNGVKQ
jgi:hypothetical protein